MWKKREHYAPVLVLLLLGPYALLSGQSSDLSSGLAESGNLQPLTYSVSPTDLDALMQLQLSTQNEITQIERNLAELRQSLETRTKQVYVLRQQSKSSESKIARLLQLLKSKENEMLSLEMNLSALTKRYAAISQALTTALQERDALAKTRDEVLKSYSELGTAATAKMSELEGRIVLVGVLSSLGGIGGTLLVLWIAGALK